MISIVLWFSFVLIGIFFSGLFFYFCTLILPFAGVEQGVEVIVAT